MRNGLLLLFLACGFPGISQVFITGEITGAKGQSLAGVSITLRGTYDGGTTDSAGRYSIETFESGSHVLDISFTGYRTVEKEIELSGRNLVQDIQLKEMITELKAVVISAGTFEAGDKKKGTVLSALDIVTTASANGDITEAIKSLPGAQQVGESEGLFVRGGTAAESGIYIDGNLVNNFFYSSMPGLASRGRFNPFLFKGTIFSSGGYSALYGQALSSVLLLESKDLPERTQADISVSVIGVGGGIQKLSKDKRSSWGATYNYANLWPAFNIIPQNQEFHDVPVYHQGDLNYRRRTKNGFLKYYGYFNWNKLGFRAEDLDSALLKNEFNLANINSYHNFSYRGNLGKGWKINPSFSFSSNRDDIFNRLLESDNTKAGFFSPEGYMDKNFDVDSRETSMQARFVMDKRLKGLNILRFGGEQFFRNNKILFTSWDGQEFNQLYDQDLTAIFAETDIYITNSLTAKTGLRSEYSSVLHQWNHAPRVSLAYKTGENSQASFAYGIFYQDPGKGLIPVEDFIGSSKATHYIAQYMKISSGRILRVEAYYKDYNNLYKTGTGNNGRSVAISNNGHGYAKGIELFWRDKTSIKNLDYWISYSFLDTRRDHLNFPGIMEPSFAARHTAAIVVKKFHLPWKLGINGSYNIASGRPYYNLRYNSLENKYSVEESGRTIPYQNISLSLNYIPTLGKQDAKSFVVWVLSVSNVLNQKQVFGYNFGPITNRRSEILPGSRSFVFLGCFLSFGIDRTQDAINNNL